MQFLRGIFYLGCGSLLVIFAVGALYGILTSLLGIRH